MQAHRQFFAELGAQALQVGGYDGIVFGVDHYRCLDFGKDGLDGSIAFHGHIAGTLTHEQLYTRHAVEGQPAQQPEIVACGPHEESVVAHGACGGDAVFLLPGIECGCRRNGVGHVNPAGHTSGSRGAAFRSHCGLMGKAGFAEVDMAVDDAGHESGSGCVDNFGGLAGKFCRCRPLPGTDYTFAFDGHIS